VTALRGSPEFWDAVVEAAARLGIAERHVEKDYWVTATLRALAERFDGLYLFKGGTSLSKAYHLLERFSEDIDLPLVSDEGSATEDLPDELASVVGEVCGSVGIVDDRTEGFARRMLFAYPELPNTPNGTWDASPDRHRTRRVRWHAMR
jgi:predicted nucleotidyltransferase component of viral defense system